MYAVINENGSYAGVPCETFEEARELWANGKGRKIFKLDTNSEIEELYKADEEEEHRKELELRKEILKGMFNLRNC